MQFIVSAPWMKDAKNTYSYDIKMELEEVTEHNEYIMTVIPDKVWLSSNERVYPIKIDPSWSTSTANHIEDNEYK